MIQSGRLIHQIVIQVQTGETQSATGSTTPIFSDADEAWVEIKPLHGRNVEIALARTKGRTVSHQITMRYNPLVQVVKSRFRFEDRYFEIFSVVNVLERNIDLDVLANEIVA